MEGRTEKALLALFFGGVACTPAPTQVNSGSSTLGSGTTGGSGTTTSTMADDTGAGTGTGSAGSTSGSSGPTLDTGTTTDTATAGTTTGGEESSSTGGFTCMNDGECTGGLCIEQACMPVASCREIQMISAGDPRPSGVYEMDRDGDGGQPPYDAYCEMDVMGGGWTLALKADGGSAVFEWSSGLWTNQNTHQAAFSDLDRNEAKLQSYMSVPVNEVLLGMEHPIGNGGDPLGIQWRSMSVVGDSLFALVSPGAHVPTGLGRDAWLGLIGGSTLQIHCNREGLNAAADLGNHVAMRIGIIANEQEDCGSADSMLGVGGRPGAGDEFCGITYGPHGNFSGCEGDGGNVSLSAFGWVLVR